MACRTLLLDCRHAACRRTGGSTRREGRPRPAFWGRPGAIRDLAVRDVEVAATLDEEDGSTSLDRFLKTLSLKASPKTPLSRSLGSLGAIPAVDRLRVEGVSLTLVRRRAGK